MKDAVDTPGGGAESGLFGSAVDRREDAALISGDAEYTADIEYPRMVHAAVVRSQFGHATIDAIETEPAERVDGVVAVYTAEDIQASAACRAT